MHNPQAQVSCSDRQNLHETKKPSEWYNKVNNDRQALYLQMDKGFLNGRLPGNYLFYELSFSTAFVWHRCAQQITASTVDHLPSGTTYQLTYLLVSTDMYGSTDISATQEIIQVYH